MFIVVAHINERRVVKIMEGPYERSLTTKKLQEFDMTVIERMRALAATYPPNEYDIINPRVPNLVYLAREYPEFSGWESVPIEEIS